MYNLVKPICTWIGIHATFVRVHPVYMAKRTNRPTAGKPKRSKREVVPKTTIHAWRLATIDPKTGKPITQPRVAELMGKSHATVQRTEAASQNATLKVLRGISKVYGVTVGTLLDHWPSPINQFNELMRFWAKVPEENREKVLKSLDIYTDDFPPTDRPRPSATTHQTEDV